MAMCGALVQHNICFGKPDGTNLVTILTLPLLLYSAQIFSVNKTLLFKGLNNMYQNKWTRLECASKSYGHVWCFSTTQ